MLGLAIALAICAGLKRELVRDCLLRGRSSYSPNAIEEQLLAQIREFGHRNGTHAVSMLCVHSMKWLLVKGESDGRYMAGSVLQHV